MVTAEAHHISNIGSNGSLFAFESFLSLLCKEVETIQLLSELRGQVLVYLVRQKPPQDS